MNSLVTFWYKLELIKFYQWITPIFHQILLVQDMKKPFQTKTDEYFLVIQKIHQCVSVLNSFTSLSSTLVLLLVANCIKTLVKNALKLFASNCYQCFHVTAYLSVENQYELFWSNSHQCANGFLLRNPQLDCEATFLVYLGQGFNLLTKSLSRRHRLIS